MTGVPPGGARPLRLAHRGDARRAAENTLEALLAAVAIPGCDGVELDIRLSRDGLPVLLHDATLGRVQHRPERVGRLTATELARLGVPTLERVLAALPAAAFVDVELKGEDHGDRTAAALRDARGPSPDRAIVSSFEGPALVAMADRLPGWTRWLNAEDLSPGTLSLAVGLGCRAVSVRWAAITPASMARARSAGLEVAAWTVRRRPTLERLGRLGIVAACVEGAALDG